MRIPARFMQHNVSIRPFRGTEPSGLPLLDDARTVRAYVEDQRHTVTTADGSEVVASTRVFVDPENYAAQGSEVTVWPGTDKERTGTVIAASFFDDRQMPSHAALSLL